MSVEGKWLTVEEYADLMGFHPQVIRDKCRMGKIKQATKASGHWRIYYEQPVDAQAREQIQSIVDSIVEDLIDIIEYRIQLLERLKSRLVIEEGAQD